MGALQIIREQLPKFLEEDQAEGFKGVLDTVLPQDLSDVALMLAGGPFGKAIKAGALATAGATYSPEALAAKFAWMTPERIKQLLHMSGYTMDGQKAKSALTLMKPSEMVKSTTPDQALRDKITKEAGRYDPYRQQSNNQRLYLEMDPFTGEVVEHEGRHRLSALLKASGSDTPVPLELRMPYDGKASIDKWSELQGRKMKGQRFDGEKRRSSPVTVNEVTPLAYDTPEEELMKYVREVDVPLKNVGINLKPEGPGFTDAEMTAYLYDSIPYGKVPPPQEKFTHPIKVLSTPEFLKRLDEWRALPDDKPEWPQWARQFYPEGVK
jgi:hypothetical protein